MSQILTSNQAHLVSKKLTNANIVLVGGCFDILHVGHIDFLRAAKKQGDRVIVLLESDEKIREIKGKNRPINNQKVRAKVLNALKDVDIIILLKYPMNNQDYDNLVISLKPTIIATTQGDPYRLHKERQASIIGARVVDVIAHNQSISTTKIAKRVEKVT